MTARRHRHRNALIARAMLALWLLMTVFNVVHACALQAHSDFGTAAAIIAPQGPEGADQGAPADGRCSAAEPAFVKAQTSDSASAPPPLQAQPRAAWRLDEPGRAPACVDGLPPPGAPLLIRFLRLTI